MLKTTVFGGLIPKASGIRLPDNAAQIAQDLMPAAAEFRPVADDLTVIANTGHTGAHTIFRLQRDSSGALNTSVGTLSTWRIDDGYVSYARGQVNQDLTERTVKSFDNGSAAPRMIDAQGGDRLLGVPRPAAAPTIAVNVVDEFTSDEKSQGIDEALLYIKNNVAVDMQPVWLGADHPGTSLPGYVDRDNTIDGDPSEAQQLRVFQLASSGGANSGGITDTFTGLGATNYQWVLDPTLGGFYGTAGASPAWATEGRDLWLIPFHAYGMTYSFDTAAMTTTLATMADIPPADGVPLMTTEQVTEVMGMVTTLIGQYDTAAQPKINALKAQVQSLEAMLGGGGAAQVTASIQDFYSSTATQDKLDAAFAQFAEAVWNQALQVHNFVPFTDITGGGA